MKSSSQQKSGLEAPAGLAESLDWLEEVALRRLTEAEISLRRRELGGRPAELRQFEAELALNRILESRVITAQPSTNFTARVRARIETEERSALHRGSKREANGHPWFHWLRPASRLGAGVAVVAIGTLGILILNRQNRSELAHSLAAVARSTDGRELTAESLANYDVIQRLGTTPQPGDEALIAALAEAPTR